jgi:hypothetical protein
MSCLVVLLFGLAVIEVAAVIGIVAWRLRR